MNKEEWKEIEEKLKSFFEVVKLNCDGYEVSLSLQRVSQYKNAIVVYVNGKFKHEWINKDCEESRRFLKKVSKSFYSQKQKNKYKKLSKKLQKELGVDVDKKYSYYLPYWTSFNSLKRQLAKENNSIKLITNEQGCEANEDK